MSYDEQRRQDLRRTCLHEYAHFHVARQLGIVGWVDIRENPTGGPGLHHYIGQFNHVAIESDRSRKLVALAGTVAELIDEDADVQAFQVMEYLDPEFGTLELSATDAALAGEFDEGDVESTLELVRALWKNILSETSLRVRVLAS